MFTLDIILRNHLENVDFLNSASVRCNAGAIIVFHAQLGRFVQIQVIHYRLQSK